MPTGNVVIAWPSHSMLTQTKMTMTSPVNIILGGCLDELLHPKTQEAFWERDRKTIRTRQWRRVVWRACLGTWQACDTHELLPIQACWKFQLGEGRGSWCPHYLGSSGELMVSEGGRTTFLGGKCPFGRLPMTQPTSAHMGNSNWIQWLIFLKEDMKLGG